MRIDVAYTGICGTDLHILHGAMDQRVTVPAVIGHEMSGRIAEIGPGVVGWAVGDPVTVMPLDWCGDCPACQRGHAHICQRLNFVGIDSAGSMQASWTVPRQAAGPAAAGRCRWRSAPWSNRRPSPCTTCGGPACKPARRCSWSAAARSGVLIALVAPGQSAPT